MSDDIVELTTRDQLAALITTLSRSLYAYKVPLLRAVQAGTIALCEIRRDGVPPLKRLDRTGRPVVVLLGDDDYRSTGPAGWVAAPRLMYWARGAFVHGTGGTAKDYRGAVDMAISCGKLLLVETSSERAMDWISEVQRAPHGISAVLKLPHTPGLHPLPLSKGEIQ